MLLFKRLLMVLVGLASMTVQAVELPPAAAQALAKIIPDEKPDAVENAPMKGLYEVDYGPRVLYITGDGRYVLQGSIHDLKTGENLTETRQGILTNAALAKIGEDKMIIFRAAKPKHTITVFTDIDCGYCRKFHSHIGELNKDGITVRYLFFPRSGPDTPSYYKAISVWCSKDRQQALTNAKNDRPLPAKTCDNPVDEDLALVHKLGLRGTPAIVMENGHIIPGYVPPKRLEAMLDDAQAN